MERTDHRANLITELHANIAYWRAALEKTSDPQEIDELADLIAGVTIFLEDHLGERIHALI